MSELRCGTCGELEYPQWISVKDQFPPLYEEVLLYFNIYSFEENYKEIMKSDFHVGHTDGANFFACSFWESKRLGKLINVTHWMPLPSVDSIENAPIAPAE